MRFTFVSMIVLSGFLLSSAPAKAWPTRNPELLSVELRNVTINYLNMNEINKRRESAKKREELTGKHGESYPENFVYKFLSQYAEETKELLETLEETNKMPLKFADGTTTDFEELAYKDPQAAYELLFSKLYMNDGEATVERGNQTNVNRGHIMEQEIATGVGYSLWNQKRAKKAKIDRKKILAEQIKSAPNLRAAQVAYSMSEFTILLELIAKAQNDVHYSANIIASNILNTESHRTFNTKRDWQNNDSSSDPTTTE